MSKTTEYKLFRVPPRWLFLKLETTDGVAGRGKPVVEGYAHGVRAAVGELMDSYVLGTDPTAIEDCWQTMYRGGFYCGGPVLIGTIVGINQVLWDIERKYFGVPVHELLDGMMRDRVHVYQWADRDRPSEVVEQAEPKVEAGLTAAKMNAAAEFERIDTPASVQAAADRLEEVREVADPEIGIDVDFHGHISKSVAKRLVKAPEPYEPMSIEEPVLPEHSDVLPRIAQHITTSIVMGERMYSCWDFKQVFKSGTVDLIQPDLSYTGDITEVKKITSMVETYDTAFIPHCPLGPIALTSYFQADTYSSNALIQEQNPNIHYSQRNDAFDYLEDKSAPEYEDGYVMVPDKPGLGIQMDEQYIRKQVEHPVSQHDPVWRHEDGSAAG